MVFSKLTFKKYKHITNLLKFGSFEQDFEIISKTQPSREGCICIIFERALLELFPIKYIMQSFNGVSVATLKKPIFWSCKKYKSTKKVIYKKVSNGGRWSPTYIVFSAKIIFFQKFYKKHSQSSFNQNRQTFSLSCSLIFASLELSFKV